MNSGNPIPMRFQVIACWRGDLGMDLVDWAPTKSEALEMARKWAEDEGEVEKVLVYDLMGRKGKGRKETWVYNAK